MLEWGTGQKGRKGKNWDNCNSMINKTYFKKAVNLSTSKCMGFYFKFLIFKLIALQSEIVHANHVEFAETIL